MGSLADGCSGSALPPTADRSDMVGGAANPAPRGAAAQRPARLFSSLPGPRIRVPLSLLGHRFRLPPARTPGGGGSIISAHYPRFLGSDSREEHRGLRRGLGRGTELVADVYRAEGALPRPLRPHAFPRRLGGPRRRARPATGAPRRRFRPPSSPVRGTATRRGRRRRPRRQAGRGANGPSDPPLDQRTGPRGALGAVGARHADLRRETVPAVGERRRELPCDGLGRASRCAEEVVPLRVEDAQHADERAVDRLDAGAGAGDGVAGCEPEHPGDVAAQAPGHERPEPFDGQHLARALRRETEDVLEHQGADGHEGADEDRRQGGDDPGQQQAEAERGQRDEEQGDHEQEDFHGAPPGDRHRTTAGRASQRRVTRGGRPPRLEARRAGPTLAASAASVTGALLRLSHQGEEFTARAASSGIGLRPWGRLDTARSPRGCSAAGFTLPVRSEPVVLAAERLRLSKMRVRRRDARGFAWRRMSVAPPGTVIVASWPRGMLRSRRMLWRVPRPSVYVTSTQSTA